jgi:hypothetical protein
VIEISSLQPSNRHAHLHESDRTLRDGSQGGAVPGTSWLATIVLSLRDKIHSTAEGLGKEGCSTFGVLRRGK